MATIPNIAITISSFSISIEPRDTKYKASNMSPLCTKVSPGGTCVVLNLMDKALKQPGLAPEIQQKYKIYTNHMILFGNATELQ